ncbi:hypothetical protein [Bernardetia sp. MNP-M8]|uniref:hypothetical protein n=1 Tax=Bernardetia sp. MNP-M8 TaxID=3127470 RepID=UPI0030D07B85
MIHYYIPNKQSYYFRFPIAVLKEYNGIDNLDITIDDNLVYFITKPILEEQIEFNVNLIWEQKDYLDIHLEINEEKFNPKIVLNSLKENQMINGLESLKEEYGKLNKILC